LIVFLLFFQSFSILFIPKDGIHDLVWNAYITKAYRGEKKDSIDVLLIGNSDLYRGFTPIDCWKNYGISSCVSGKPWQNPRGAYNILRDALRYQKPRVVILETDMFYSEKPRTTLKKFTLKALKSFRSDFFSGKATLFKSMDSKIDYMIQAMSRSSFSGEIQYLDDGLETKINYYFPLLVYHQRWSSLNSKDITDINNVWHFASKGYVLSKKNNPYLNGYDYMAVTSTNPVEISERPLGYLYKIIELCNQNNINLILLSIPSANSWSGQKHNTVAEFAKSNNLEFIDYNLPETDTGFDWLTDSVDGGNHLNYFGAIKITAKFGAYLKEQYQLADHRGDPAYAQWESDSKILTES
jgi:hypothetical protein